MTFGRHENGYVHTGFSGHIGVYEVLLEEVAKQSSFFDVENAVSVTVSIL